MELAKNQEHTVTIEGYGEGGMGVARIHPPRLQPSEHKHSGNAARNLQQPSARHDTTALFTGHSPLLA